MNVLEQLNLIQSSNDCFAIWAWQERDGLSLPPIVQEWIKRNYATVKTVKQYIASKSERRDIYLNQVAIDEGKLSDGDYLDFQDQLNRRKFWYLNVYVPSGEKLADATSEYLRIINLMAAAVGRHESAYNMRRNQLLDAGYPLEILDTVQMLTVQEWKEKITKESPLSSANEWLTDEEYAAMKESGVSLQTAYEIALTLPTISERIEFEKYLEKYIKPTVVRLVPNHHAKNISDIYTPLKYWDVSTINIDAIKNAIS